MNNIFPWAILAASAAFLIAADGSAVPGRLAAQAAAQSPSTQLPRNGPVWPQFRGPAADGQAPAKALPLTWNENNHVKWKTAIHDLGWSSPVIWGEQIWLTTATEDGKQMFAMCVNKDTGQVVHDVKVFDTESPQHIASVNTYASPTPVVEEGRAYVHYGTYGTACLDTRTGKVLWTRRDLNCDHHEGPGSSPMLYGNLCIVNVDGRDVQYVVALDKTDGRTVWKTPRSVDYSVFPYNCRKAFCMPILVESDGRLQLVSPGAKAVIAYQPLTGEEIWKVRYNGWSMTPRPLYGHGLIFVINDYERPELYAIKPGGTGDVTASHVAWKITKDMPATASLLLVEDLLYMANDQGWALCVEAKTGQVVWREKLKGKHSASPVYGAGRIYFFSEKGLATVMAPGRQYQCLAENPLNERMMASPAVVDQALVVRTQTQLYRLED